MSAYRHLHGGHRARMRQRWARTGGEGFADHELLEMLLYYAYPYRDTNPIAHDLLRQAGELSALADLPPERLTSIPGVTPRTVGLLRAALLLARRAAGRENACEAIDSVQRAGAFFMRFFGRQTADQTALLLLDNRCAPLDCLRIFDGRASSAAFRPVLAARPALEQKAASVMLATYHSDRIARADAEEMEAGIRLKQDLGLLGIHLLDWIYVTENYFTALSARLPLLFGTGSAPLLPEHQQERQVASAHEPEPAS